MEFKNRLKVLIAYLKANNYIKTQKELGFNLGFETESAFSQVVTCKVPFSETLYYKLKTLYPFINIEWLKNEVGGMIKASIQIKPNKEVDTVDFVDIPDLEDENLESLENSFGNKFVKLPTGGYLMYMPMFEWDVAASLLDNEGDTRHPDYEDVAQHVTIVNEPLKGKYSAFRIKGGSMEGTEVNKYIPDGSIVWGRELQRSHWGDNLRINKYPLWIVGSTEFGRPTLKEIKLHDLLTATIVVDSWNPSKEYAHNVAISLNTVKMLYYVMKVETSISHIY